MKYSVKYSEFYNEYKKDYQYDSGQLESIINKWKEYRRKILSDDPNDFSAEDYNSKNEFFENDNYSLRQFIERVCANCFGTLGTIKSSELGLWVTGKPDAKIYKYKKEEITGDAIADRTSQTKAFLKELITKYRWDDLMTFLSGDETFNDIGYPSFIFGMVFLDSILKDDDLTDEEKREGSHFDYQYQLIWIYKYDDIEKNKEFKSIASTRNPYDNHSLLPFLKSKALCEKCMNLTSAQTSVDTVLLFERTVWEYTHDITKTEKNIIDALDDDNKQIVLTGAPGTGKTYAAQKIAMVDECAKIISKGVDKKGNEIEIKYQFVQFHPSFDYSDFVEGLRPVNINGNTTFVRVDGVFKEFCRRAAFDYKINNNDDDYSTRYYFIIDEINRADLSKVFGELMYCLEYRGVTGKVKTQYSNLDTYVITPKGPMTFDQIKTYNDAQTLFSKKIDMQLYGEEDLFKDGFYIPENVYIVGTMNDIDRSVESFDFALRRRFNWFEIKAGEVMGEVLPKILNNTTAYDFVKDRIKALNDYISDPESNGVGLSDAYCIGPAYFKSFGDSDSQYTTKLAKIYKNEIEPTLKEYVRGRDQNSIENFLDGCRGKFGLDKNYKWN